jgi:hypothetical protein
MTAVQHLRFRELAQREGDGLDVRLIWSKANNALKVIVTDAKLGETIIVPVQGENPLEVFHHPFAYAAARGLV